MDAYLPRLQQERSESVNDHGCSVACLDVLIPGKCVTKTEVVCVLVDRTWASNGRPMKNES